MRISTTKKIGKKEYVFTGEGENLYEAVNDLQKASFGDIATCGVCNSDALYLEAHLAQGKYKYASIKCSKCRASLTFGKREDNTDVSFLRRTDDGKYDWKEYTPSK